MVEELQELIDPSVASDNTEDQISRLLGSMANLCLSSIEDDADTRKGDIIRRKAQQKVSDLFDALLDTNNEEGLYSFRDEGIIIGAVKAYISDPDDEGLAGKLVGITTNMFEQFDLPGFTEEEEADGVPYLYGILFDSAGMIEKPEWEIIRKALRKKR